MRLNFLQQQVAESDLANEFTKLVIIKARCNSEPLKTYILADELCKAGLCHPLVAAAAKQTSWSELMAPWLRYNGPQREKWLSAVRKAAIPVGTTFDSQYASPLVALQTLANAWFASLRNVSMLDALLQDAKPLPPNTIYAVTTARGNGNSALEAEWISLSKDAFSSAIAAPSRALALVVVSEDLLKFGGDLANNLLGAELRSAVAVAADLEVLGTLTAGLTPISSVGNPRADLRNAFKAVNLGQMSKPYIFTSPEMLKQMSMMGETGGGTPSHSGPPTFPDLALPNGGSIGGVPTMAIDVLAGFPGSPSGDSMLVVDAAQLAGDPGIIDVLASNDATLQMASGISVGSPEDEPTAATLVSMFQTNSVALRATRWWMLQRARASAVAVVEGCSYDLS
jgi:hypothetical protein